MASKPEIPRRVEELFEAALDRPTAARDAYLDEACGADPELRREVEDLLAADARAGDAGFLDVPVPAADLIPTAPAAAGEGALAPEELVAGRFRVARFVAGGGMGEVYEAEDLELGERVAIKAIRPGAAGDEAARRRFRREVHLARQVTHPNVCRIYDLFHHPPEGSRDAGEVPRIILSMELLDGETLEERLRRRGPLPPDEALPILRQVAGGVAAAHDRGIVHRDLKSSNVLLVPSPGGERAVVTDFGVARPARLEGPRRGTRLTVTGMIVGTPHYMAPEQLAGEEVTPAADVYALGVLLFEMVSGHLPFEGATPVAAALRSSSGDLPSLRTLVPDLDPRWDEAVRCCLRGRPEERFAGPRELLRFLEGRRFTPGRRTVVPLLAAVLTAILAGGAWWLAGRHSAPAAGDPEARDSGGRSEGLTGAGPTDPEAARLYTAGLDRLRAFDTVAARDLLLEASRAEPGLPRVHSALAESWAVLGHDAEAEAEARRAVELSAGSEREERLRAEGLQHLVSGSRPRAVEIFRSLHEFFPGDLEHGRRLATAEIAAGHAAEALETVGRLRRLPGAGDDAHLDLLEGEAAEALADYRRARDAASRVIERTDASEQGLAARAHLLRGRALWRLGEGEAGSADAGRAEALFRDAGDRTGVAHALNLAAKLEAAKGEIEAARQRLELALAAHRAIGHRAGVMHALMDLAILDHTGDPETARARHEEALAIASDLGDRGFVSGQLANLALLRLTGGDLEGAREFYEEALAIARDLGDRGQESTCLYNLGLVDWRRGDLTAAAERYREALPIAREIGDLAAVARLLNNLGIALRQLGHLEEAQKSYEESLALARDLGDPVLVARRLANLANVQRQRGEYAAARHGYDEALTLHRELDDASGRASALSGLATLELCRNDLGDARRHFEEALALRRDLNQARRIPQARRNLAELALAEGRPQVAEDLAREVAREFAALDRRDRQSDAWVLVARALLDQDRLAEAREALARAEALQTADRDSEDHLRLELVAARAETMGGAVEAALARLDEVIAEASEADLGGLWLDARLARGEIALAAGTADAREELAALARDAAVKGCERIAATARKLSAR